MIHILFAIVSQNIGWALKVNCFDFVQSHGFPKQGNGGRGEQLKFCENWPHSLLGGKTGLLGEANATAAPALVKIYHLSQSLPSRIKLFPPLIDIKHFYCGVENDSCWWCRRGECNNILDVFVKLKIVLQVNQGVRFDHIQLYHTHTEDMTSICI